MQLENYPHHPWKIIEEGWLAENVKSSESIFSIGNGAMGQRANFEEDYSGASFQGSYVGGVYYPDKTKVGWWKNGYPEYFAKVLNAPNWIGIHITIEGENFDLAKAKEIKNYRRELDMQTGLYSRDFIAVLNNGLEITVKSKRFLSLARPELGVIDYSIKTNKDTQISIVPYLDAGISNQDSNWDDQFWDVDQAWAKESQAYIEAHTLKTNFSVGTFMAASLWDNDQAVAPYKTSTEDNKVSVCFDHHLSAGNTLRIAKLGGYISSRNHPKEHLEQRAIKVLNEAKTHSFDALYQEQKAAWKQVWKSGDIAIEGDIKAQQAIRFNIFQLNQTYTGEDPELNIGPKGFTGEKYGGSTYWDTEAYCIPFYMATKNQKVARNLLTYRYLQLDRAIENATKLGFKKGAALYPMVTMNGEECHNEWEITFEEIHRNSAIAFAIFNYTRYTADQSYIPEMGLEVLIGIARFWAQRASYSSAKQQYVILGVTGPNEYENNVNNNFYTNYIAKWCIEFTLESLEEIKLKDNANYQKIISDTRLTKTELEHLKSVSERVYFPYSERYSVYLQQDGFLDKSLMPTTEINPKERPINQYWSWDRILRSPYIKQADTLQTFYFFEEDFSLESLEKHFDFYEPLTVHESSLSPCVHSILAAKLGRMDQAYEFYLRTSRLDLDDYNHEVHEGLHITSMAGTWMSIVEGFGGMRIKNNTLHFTPQIPNEWTSYSFKIIFRGNIIKVKVHKSGASFEVDGDKPLKIYVNNKPLTVEPNSFVKI